MVRLPATTVGNGGRVPRDIARSTPKAAALPLERQQTRKLTARGPRFQQAGSKPIKQ